MRTGKFVVLALVLLGVIAGVLVWQLGTPRELTYPQAVARLDSLLKCVSWSESTVTRTGVVTVVTMAKAELHETLPDISKYELVVNPPISSNEVAVEIFASVEKAGKGFDGWMVEVANDFNRSNLRLRNGYIAKVKIRAIASGEAYQFIAARKYLPDAYSPSHALWLQMLTARGVPLIPVTERLLGNTAGIVMKERVQRTLQEKYGTVGVRQIIDAVMQGRIAMGYTDPFVSSTGLNFLVMVLATLAQGEPAHMLSDDVVSAFAAFQRGVPFVALTTLQMRDSVQRDGSLEAFVMERAIFAKAPVFQAGYTFIPFGIRHDSPLYGIGTLPAEKQEVLQQFAQFASQAPAQKLATEYGFNQLPDYTPAFAPPPGEVLIEAQRLWKRQKDAGRPIVAVFLGDVSSSMEGVSLHNLQRALLAGSQFIDPENSLGLVVFNQEVKQLLPVGKFTLSQRALFTAAVQDMSAGGGH